MSRQIDTQDWTRTVVHRTSAMSPAARRRAAITPFMLALCSAPSRPRRCAPPPHWHPTRLPRWGPRLVGASGLDRACAQLSPWPSRDGHSIAGIGIDVS